MKEKEVVMETSSHCYSVQLLHSNDRSSAHFRTGCRVGGVKEGVGFKGVVNLVIYSVSLQYLSPGWWMKVADWWLHHPGPWLMTKLGKEPIEQQ